MIGRFGSIDPLTSSFPWNSPYAFAVNSPLQFIDKAGARPEDIIVTSSDGTELFRLDDGNNDVTIMTAKELYSEGTQWWEPLASNYMPMIETYEGLYARDRAKHFSLSQVEEFAKVDQWSLAHRTGGGGGGGGGGGKEIGKKQKKEEMDICLLQSTNCHTGEMLSVKSHLLMISLKNKRKMGWSAMKLYLQHWS